MGTLYLVSTPIGNLEDITVRAIKTLLTVPVIACEDTRRTGQLVATLKERYKEYAADTEKMRFVRYDNQVEHTVTTELIDVLERNQSVALVSDAGTPLICDPGFLLVREATKRSIPIEVIPGVSAFVAALTRSGLPSNQILFLGYLPEKEGQRKTLLADLKSLHIERKQIQPTIVFYCAPHKLLQTLSDVKDCFGDISIVIARELTKIHEEVWSGSISGATQHFKNAKGEFVVLVHL